MPKIPKKILFTGLFPYWQPHIIAEFNFIEEHLQLGDDITFLTCEASLRACDVNPGRKLPECLVCMGVRQSGISLLSGKIKKELLVNPNNSTKNSWVYDLSFKSIDELKRYEYEKLPIGADIISSLISATADTSFDPKQHEELVKKAVFDYINVFQSAVALLKQYQYHTVYIFNGRFIPAKAWIRACESRGVDYIAHERLVRPEAVLKIKNGSPHDVTRYAQQIKLFWEKNKTRPEIIRQGREFFEERPDGRSTGWFSFTAGQDKKSLPANWDTSKRNIAIFSSTESEFAGLQKYFEDAPFRNQNDAYSDLVSRIGEMDDTIHFYLRIHPNSKGEKNRWWESTSLNQLDNISIIPPESSISSYNLLRNCEKTIVFMTTMGIEATYWHKPSILLSNAFYKGINATYEPNSIDEVINYVLDLNLLPKPRENALAFGAFMRCGGYQLPYSQAVNYHLIGFKGNVLGAKTEVFEWQQKSSSRKPVQGIKKIVRDTLDEWYFGKIIRNLKGDLKACRKL